MLSEGVDDEASKRRIGSTSLYREDVPQTSLRNLDL